MASIPFTTFTAEVLEKNVRTTNMFALELNTGLDAVDEAFANLTLYVRDFKAPSRGIKYDNLYFRGVPFPVPTNPVLKQEVTFQMWCDMSGAAQKACRLWQDSIIDMDFKAGSYLGGSRQINMSSTLRLQLLDHDMQTTNEAICLNGVSIREIGETAFANTEAEICWFPVSVVFAYPSYEED